MTIAVIGAGASGLAAALQAAWNGAPVTLFERNPTLGRKLLVTGSGRCNITNAAVAAEKFACADPAWMEELLTGFPVRALLAMLAEIGILVYQTSDGWYYPLSDSAHTVVDAFSSALAQAGVTLCASTQVIAIWAAKPGLTLRYTRGDRESEAVFDRVIVAAGGMAYPTLGSRGELFPILERLGHTVLPLRPALAPVLVELGELRALQGARLDAGVTLWRGAQRLAQSNGNLIVTQWGLNGPAVMDISHQVSAHPGAALELSLNFLAFFDADYENLLAQKRKSPLPLRVFLGAFFAPKVAAFLLKNARLPEDLALSQASESQMARLGSMLRDLRLAVKGVREFEYCQVTAGGVPVGEVHARTLESRRVPGLHLVGETLDVVGPCGGYNLHYAFASGALAGQAAARR